MSTLPNKNAKNNLQKKCTLQQSLNTLKQLASRPNITIKKKIVLKNYTNQNNIKPQSTSLAKVTNTQNNKTTVRYQITDAQKELIASQCQVIEGKKEKELSKNVTVKKNVKSMEKLTGEYYPERRKRSIQLKKIKLRPKHHYKVVATTNKRKRGMPCRGVDSIQPPQPAFQSSSLFSPEPKLSMGCASLVELMEQQDLADEDLREILTCPSPVWWEDSADEDDDSSFEELDGDTTKMVENTRQKDDKITTDGNSNKKPSRIKILSHANVLKKFASKRSKLETILGNIKGKKTISEVYVRDEIDFNIKENICEGRENLTNTKPNLRDISSQNTDTEENIKDEKENEIDSEETTTDEFGSRKDSPGCLSDVSFNEEELLLTLETLELPVKNINKGQNRDMLESNEIFMMEIGKLDAGNSPTNVNNVSNKRKRTRKPRILKDKESKSKKKNMWIEENTDKITLSRDETDMSKVPTDLPPLTKNPFKNVSKAYESPKSIESVSDTTSFVEFDSISDTNIKFLDEYVDSKKETNEAVNVKKYGKGQDGELVTVFQIINKPEDNMDVDIEEQIKVNLVNKSPQISIDVNKNYGDIDTFYKTRKNAFSSRSKGKRK